MYTCNELIKWRNCLNIAEKRESVNHCNDRKGLTHLPYLKVGKQIPKCFVIIFFYFLGDYFFIIILSNNNKKWLTFEVKKCLRPNLVLGKTWLILVVLFIMKWKYFVLYLAIILDF